MIFLRFLLKIVFALSCAFTIAFFIALFGGAALVEKILDKPVKMDIFRFLATGMPIAIVGTLTGTLGGKSQQKGFHLRTVLITLVMAVIFAVCGQFLL